MPDVFQIQIQNRFDTQLDDFRSKTRRFTTFFHQQNKLSEMLDKNIPYYCFYIRWKNKNISRKATQVEEWGSD